MHRHCYSICLFLATLGAVVVCLRPQWGVQWLAQIETWVQKAQAADPSDALTLQNNPGSYPLAYSDSPLLDGNNPPRPIRPPSQDSTESDESEQILPGESIPYQPPEQSGAANSARAPYSERLPYRQEALGEKSPPQMGFSQDFGRLRQDDVQGVSSQEPPKWWNNSNSFDGFPIPPPETFPRQEASPSPPEEGENDATWEKTPRMGNIIPPSSAKGGPESFRPPLWQTPQTPTGDAPSTEGRLQAELPAEKQPCEGARVVARVATDVVLMSDLWVSAEQFLISLYFRQKSLQPQVPPPPPLEALLAQREALVQAQSAHLIRQLVDAKLAYYDALSVVPQESLKNMEQQVARHFEKVELPRFLAFYQVETYPELEERLRQGGTSLARHRRLYFERTLASQWLAQKVKVNEEVGYEEMWRWYQEHLTEFEQPAQVQWEQISVRISKYPSREAAWAALAHAGNLVLDGQPFADVARQFSDAPNASEGGLRDWTTLGSLRSDILNQALAQLPIGALSPILEDGDWLHIVRVLQRQDAHRIPFVEAQVKIREEIRKQRTQIQHQAYLDQLRARVPVWTVLDQRPGRSRTAAVPRLEY